MVDFSYVKEREAAEMLSLSPNTLARWRSEGRGPIFRKFEGAVRYCIDDLRKYAERGR